MKKTLILCLLISSLFLIGCDDNKLEDEYASQNISVDSSDEDVPTSKLAEGQTLNIRLVYKINEADENSSEWYKVELKREDSAWNESVKIEGITRDAEYHWDDYTFYSKNFNYQVQNEAYKTKSLDGKYLLNITGSNGFNESHELIWENGQWTNIDPAKTFYVP